MTLIIRDNGEPEAFKGRFAEKKRRDRRGK